MKDRLSELPVGDDIIVAPVKPNGFLEEFLRKVDEVQKLMERLCLCVGEVKIRHGTILTEVNPPKYVRDELQLFSNDIKKLADLIRVKLKDLQRKFSNCEKANSSSAHCRIQSTQHTIFSLRFAEIMSVYNQELLSFRTRSKERMKRQLEISGKIITEEETEVLLQSNNPSVFTSNINSDSCFTRQALTEIELRYKDIVCLEASVRELQSMFMDIAVLVNSQGEMVNNIAKTVLKAGNYVDQGKENIIKATEYKKTWRILPFLPSFKQKAKPGTSNLLSDES